MTQSVKIAIGIACLAVLWLLSGLFFNSGERHSAATEASVIPATSDNTKVAVRESIAAPVERERIVHGRTEALRAVSMRARTDGVVEHIHIPKGSAVKKGDLLISLTMDDRKEKLGQAKATVSRAELEYEAASKLAAKQFSSRVNTASKKAALAEAEAALAAIRMDIDHTQIRAPFDGVFNDHFLEIGDTVRVGDDIVEVLALDPIKVTVNLSEQVMAKVNRDQPVTVSLLSGERLTGTTHYLSSAADPATRTYRMEVYVDNPDMALIDGLTVSVHVPTTTRESHTIPLSALTLNDAGALGVKIVDNTSRARFVPVAVVSSTSDQAWVTGLDTNVTLITVGQEFVSDGLEVSPVPDDIYNGPAESSAIGTTHPDILAPPGTGNGGSGTSGPAGG